MQKAEHGAVHVCFSGEIVDKEWCLCVAAHGTSYFSTASNWLDTFIVWVVGVFLLWIVPLVFGAEGLAAFQARGVLSQS